MKLYDLLKDVEYTVVRGGNPDIKDLIYDSRKVSDGTALTATNTPLPPLKRAQPR